MDYRHIRASRLVVAIAIVIIIAMTAMSYFRHVARLRASRQDIPNILPQNAENATVGFNYSKIESGQTVYSIKAWRNLGLKDNKNILEDVEVIVYGKGGDRFDRIHSARADYDQDAGTVQFEGDVTLLLSSKSQEARAKLLAGTNPAKALLNKTQINTSKILYSQRTNQVETDQPVRFVFNNLSGTAVGLHYDAAKDQLQLKQDVHVEMNGAAGNPPIEITGGSLSFLKSSREILLSAPVEIRRGDDVMTAQNVVLHLDADNRIQNAVATGNPALKSVSANAQMDLTADTVTANLKDEGKTLDTIVAEGNVQGASRAKTTTTEIKAQQLTAKFSGPKNELQQLVGENNVVMKILPVAGGVTPSRNVTFGKGVTPTRNVTFSKGVTPGRNVTPGDGVNSAKVAPRGAAQTSGLAFSLSNANEEKVLSSARVEITLRPGGKEIERLVCPTASTLQILSPVPTEDQKTIRGDHFEATFAEPRNVLDSFQADGHVIVDLEPKQPLPSSTHRRTQSDTLAAHFDPQSGLLSGLDQSGNFHFYELEMTARQNLKPGDLLRQATAESAHYSAATKVTTLDGRPEIWDSTTKTKAKSVVMDENSGKVSASGGVLTLYQDPKSSTGPFANSNSPVFLTADRMTGESKAKTAVYSGNARMWQDDDVIKADEIHLDQNSKTMTAGHHVLSAFLVEETGKAKKDFVSIASDTLKYEDAIHRARYEKNVVMKGEMGVLQAPRLDIFLVDQPKPHESRIDRAVAQGGVTIVQPERRARSERAEFYARDNKVVLTGDHPTIVDAAKGATTGRELTFFTRDDRIFVDGDNQSRAITQHKVARQ